MRWRLGLLSATLLALLSLYPQFSLQYSRGPEYNGAAFLNDNDESVYLAYLQSLIDGRPRKNNIYVGGAAESPETFLSIQFLPAYTVALLSRTFGLTAEAVFPILSFLFAFATALSLYWFFYKATNDEAFSAAAALFVLIIGATVAGYSAAKFFAGLGPASASLPFLRRYTPGFAFPFLFILMGSVFRAYTSGAAIRRWTWIVTSLSFIVLLYSYFYLWTSALAWMAAVIVLTLFFPSLRANGVFRRFWLPTVVTCALASLPYFWLLSQRSPSTDSLQALEAIRELVLSRPSIWVGAGAVICFLVLRFAGKISKEPIDTILILSCCLLPILVFDQHLVTGYSLQPFHYNLYCAPYFALIAVAMLFWCGAQNSIQKLGPLVGIASIIAFSIWGVIDSHYAMGYRWTANVNRDRALPVNNRLRQLASGKSVDQGELTFNSDLFQADNQPSSAPQGVLWSEHMPWASSISERDARTRYFAHLYFMNRDAPSFRESIEKCPHSAECKAIFGWRVIPTLAIGNHSPDQREIEEVADEYQRFLDEIFSTGVPRMSYAVITNPTSNFDFTNLDKWYERDAGEDLGRYSLFKLTRKNEAAGN